MSCGDCKCEKKELSNRGKEWQNFQKKVEDHIENYTVPQYGDAPNDPVSEYRERDMITQIRRYVSRLDTGQRGGNESNRDLLKIAHWAGLLYTKRTED